MIYGNEGPGQIQRGYDIALVRALLFEAIGYPRSYPTQSCRRDMIPKCEVGCYAQKLSTTSVEIS